MDEMDRLARFGLARGGQELADAMGYLPLDVAETQDAYVLTAELPGVGMDDIAVNVEDNVVTIRGERPLRTATGQVPSPERPYGAFQRSWLCPGT